MPVLLFGSSWSIHAHLVFIAISFSRVRNSIHGRRLVDRQPVQDRGFHCVPEFVEVHRLLDVAVRAKFVAADQVALFVLRTQDDHRNEHGPVIVLELFENLNSVYLRQLQIKQHDLGWAIKTAFCEGSATEQKVESILAVPNDMDVRGQLLPLQNLGGKFHIFQAIVHQ